MLNYYIPLPSFGLAEGGVAKQDRRMGSGGRKVDNDPPASPAFPPYYFPSEGGVLLSFYLPLRPLLRRKG